MSELGADPLVPILRRPISAYAHCARGLKCGPQFSLRFLRPVDLRQVQLPVR
jgi:hypothetical protein